jgi:hypothetical protein
MPRKPRYPAATMPFALWNDLALRTGEMLTSSAQVIAHRTGRMATAGHSPSLRDRREFTRMGLEKVEAVGESMWAMGQHLAQMNMQLAMKAWQDAMAAWTSPQLLKQQAQVAKKGLKPFHSRATANAKRLGRS